MENQAIYNSNQPVWGWKGIREMLLLSHEAQSGPTCQAEPWNSQQLRPGGFLESEAVAALKFHSRESGAEQGVYGEFPTSTTGAPLEAELTNLKCPRIQESSIPRALALAQPQGPHPGVSLGKIPLQLGLVRVTSQPGCNLGQNLPLKGQ